MIYNNIMYLLYIHTFVNVFYMSCFYCTLYYTKINCVYLSVIASYSSALIGFREGVIFLVMYGRKISNNFSKLETDIG